MPDILIVTQATHSTQQQTSSALGPSVIHDHTTTTIMPYNIKP